MAGERELRLTRAFFARVERRDPTVADMLDETVVFTNVEGLCIVGREAVVALLCPAETHSTTHELVSVESRAGRALARFTLAVPGIAGALFFEADLRFEEELVVAIEIREVG